MAAPAVLFRRLSNAGVWILRIALWAAVLGARSWAGGSGLNVMVVVNQASSNSVQLGNLYCELRGVPPENVLRIHTWAGGRVSWTLSEFELHLLNPLKGMLQERGLTNQAQFVLLSMDIPYRVTQGQDENSTTAALFYGFKTNGPSPGPGLPASCSLPEAAQYEQALSELPFAAARPTGGVGLYAVMLTDASLELAESNLRRTVAADRSFPSNTVYLARTSDTVRNVRYPFFDNAIFEAAVHGQRTIARIETDSTWFTNAGGLQTGLYVFTVPTNAIAPGAVADSVTSFAGGIFENQGQSTLLEFLKGGASASYGTVVEPCNYTEKFPDPMVFFYQARGFSVAEAYYQSVRYPYQGLFVTEPLSAPFARPAGGAWMSPPADATLAGEVPLQFEFEAAAPDLPLARVDLFLDGKFAHTVTNIGPTSGNRVTVNVGQSSYGYTVQPNESAWSIASELANGLNRDLGTMVKAEAHGDRVLLKQLTTTSNLGVSTVVSSGTASEATTKVTAARPAFIESPAMGMRQVEIGGKPALGDWVHLQVLKTNGSLISMAVTNTDPQATALSFAQALTNQILINPALALTDGLRAVGLHVPYGSTGAVFEVYANSPGLAAAQIEMALSGSPPLELRPANTNALLENVSDLQPRNHLYVSSGRTVLAGTFALNSSLYPDGEHDLTFVAYDGSSVRTQAPVSRRFRFRNSSLTAVLTSSVIGQAATLGAPWSVTVNTPNSAVSRIELYSTGGILASATNSSSATFAMPTYELGLGLHPVYAIVRDSTGQVYRTETLQVRIIPPFEVQLHGPPWILSWRAVAGLKYEILRTPGFGQSFQVVDRITATNNLTLLWPLPDMDAPGFYRLRVAESP